MVPQLVSRFETRHSALVIEALHSAPGHWLRRQSPAAPSYFRVICASVPGHISTVEKLIHVALGQVEPGSGRRNDLNEVENEICSPLPATAAVLGINRSD